MLKHEENVFTNEDQTALLEDSASQATIAFNYSELLEANYNLIAFGAHSLRNRIQAIRSYIGLLKNPKVNIGYKEVCDVIDSEMKRLSNAVNNKT